MNDFGNLLSRQPQAMQASTNAVEQKPGLIELAFRQLECEIDRLSGAVGRLSAKLEPVQVPIVIPGDKQAKEAETSCPMANRIRAYSSYLSTISQNIQHNIDSIQL